MGCMTIDEWCERERLSRGMYYRLVRQAKGPRTYNVGRVKRITEEAAADWRREREAESDKSEAQ